MLRVELHVEDKLRLLVPRSAAEHEHDDITVVSANISELLIDQKLRPSAKVVVA
jgi:hypothetical protein